MAMYQERYIGKVGTIKDRSTFVFFPLHV